MKKPEDVLKINKIVEIELEPDTDSGKNYQTRIEDINELGIVIGTPIEQGILVDMLPDTTVIVWHNEALASFAYYCRVRARISEPLPMIFLDWPHTIKKVQRRNFVRVSANVKIDFSIEQDQQGKDIFHSAITSDLSGGGLRFNSNILLKKRILVKLRLYLPDEQPIELTGKVAWIVDHEKKNKYLIGIEFAQINENLRDNVIRFVFIRQRELIKKGVLE